MPIPKTEIAKRLARWMLGHEQPKYLDLDHPVQEDIAAAADEIARLQALISGVAIMLAQDGDVAHALKVLRSVEQNP